MASPSEAFKVKELLVGHGTLGLQHRNFPHAPINFEETYNSFFSMDADLINSSEECTCFVAGSDLKSALEDSIEEVKEEKRIVQSVKWLLNRGGPVLLDEVIRLLDEELDSYGRDLHGKGANLLTKGQILAEYRTERNIVRDRRSLKTRDFIVHLTTLVKGDGRYANTTKLFFDVDCLFDDFLSTLQQETNNCAMPEDPCCYPINSSLSSPQTTNSLSISNLTSSNTTSTLETTNRTTANEFEDAAATKKFLALLEIQDPLLRSRRGIRGFTLKDGPWLYRIGGQGSDEFNEVTDDNSYQNMIQTVKQLNDPFLVIIHKLDRDAQKKWKDELMLEVEDQARRREELKGLDAWGDGDEEDVGQSFMTFSVGSVKKESIIELRGI